ATDWFWIRGLELATVYLLLPIFATYSALHVKNLLVISALTWAALLLPPCACWSLWNEAASIGFVSESGQAAGLAVLVGNIISARLAVWLLRQGLLRRNQPF
ncbi:MAG TPA: hypothetical protein VK731_08840, partial [Candidatus Cybelea sp.]|nr:hypothetical protein [Candidatus Cybelea sp.]